MSTFRNLTYYAFILMSRASHACVTCDSATAGQVRHGIFRDHFGHTLLMTAAPVPFMLGAAALVFYAFPLPEQRTAA